MQFIGVLALALVVVAFPRATPAAAESVFHLQREFPLTDFSKRSIHLRDIFTGLPRRDTFPTIYQPKFAPVAEVMDVGPLEPVPSVGINGDFRAYPLRILLYHELVHDEVGGVPILVTYCPLCNSGVVYDRRLDGKVLEFSNTGRLRHYDMVIYDRGTESWWQQFLGEAIIGEHTGRRLEALPARLESLSRFRDRAADGRVLVPDDPGARPYGLTGNAGTDSLPPALARERYPFDLPSEVSPLARLVVVGDEAWTVELLKERGRIESGQLVLTWEPGQNSLHDTRVIAESRDVGNVTVQRRTASGLEDVPYDVSFAFAFSAFVPGGTLHLE